nr:hypothetical protein [Tanacetum cinerariifolium]
MRPEWTKGADFCGRGWGEVMGSMESGGEGAGSGDEGLVRNKREKDKIITKPDQIKKNGKRGKARKCRRPITVKKEEKCLDAE